MTTALDKTESELEAKSNNEDFVTQYIAAREKEHRLYTNEEVMQLPDISPAHKLFHEWQIRKRSATMLSNYLKKKKGPIRILEVGCGNGWLSTYLAKKNQSEVTGIDINEVELSQAKEVFNHLKNVQFICTSIDDPQLPKSSFDVIVFAASIQYFVSVSDVIKAAQELLSEGGEIHIVDTHFYKANEVKEAESRTYRYFSSLGFPAMSKYYFHHSLTDFSLYNFSVLFEPSFIQGKLLGNPHPFYWIRIKGKG